MPYELDTDQWQIYLVPHNDYCEEECQRLFVSVFNPESATRKIGCPDHDIYGFTAKYAYCTGKVTYSFILFLTFSILFFRTSVSSADFAFFSVN